MKEPTSATEPSLGRRTHRRFSAADKQRLLAEHNALPCGEEALGCNAMRCMPAS